MKVKIPLRKIFQLIGFFIKPRRALGTLLLELGELARILADNPDLISRSGPMKELYLEPDKEERVLIILTTQNMPYFVLLISSLNGRLLKIQSLDPEKLSSCFVESETGNFESLQASIEKDYGWMRRIVLFDKQAHANIVQSVNTHREHHPLIEEALALTEEIKAQRVRFFPEPEMLPLVIHNNMKEVLMTFAPILGLEKRPSWKTAFLIPFHILKILFRLSFQKSAFEPTRLNRWTKEVSKTEQIVERK